MTEKYASIGLVGKMRLTGRWRILAGNTRDEKTSNLKASWPLPKFHGNRASGVAALQRAKTGRYGLEKSTFP